MFWTFRNAWMGGFLLAATAVCGAEPLLNSEPEAVIRVRVYDYAGVSPKTLVKAKAVASEALGSAGARLVWADCRLRAEDPVKAVRASPQVSARACAELLRKKHVDGVLTMGTTGAEG